MRLKNYTCIFLLLLCFQSVAQVKTTQAVKTSLAPRIDGVLDDAAWKDAPVLTGFIQNSPAFGLPGSQKTEVRILYDNDAIYIGAYLFDDPALIRKQFTARDGEQLKDVDYFSVFFDTYNDKQNGFQFLVTTANVQSDARVSPSYSGEFGSYGDKTWDAVWESKVSFPHDGWIAEMRIPYVSLRFSKKEVQDWGLQLLRFIRRNNETGFWNPVNPQVNGFANQFGGLTGLQNIEPPLRLSFSPYITTGFRSSPVGNSYLNEWLRNGGMDLKYGVNESFTLDATLVPDFGQVISDNVVNNLTPYEVQFQENRQFFTEGTEIFNKAKLFYSRRVGALPGGYYSVLGLAEADPNLEVLKNPMSTQLYNAVKFSGRTRNKLGIGIFNAVTAPAKAILRNRTTGRDSTIETEPLANYNIIVLDQAFKGRSSLTFTNTNVMRNGAARDANVTALDFSLYDKRNLYALQGTARYSKIWAPYSYDGYNSTLKYGKVSGNWQYYLLGNIESKNYDPNDLGILQAANEVSYRGSVSYRKFRPTRTFIDYSYTLTSRLQYLYQPYAYSKFDIEARSFWLFKNFWDLSFISGFIPGWERNYFELRTDNRPLRYPANFSFELEGSTDSRKKTYVSFDLVYALAPEYKNTYYGISLGLRYRFGNRFSLDLQAASHLEDNQLGYAFMRENNGEPIVGFRTNRDFTTVLSGIYNFAYRLNLTLRARHYWNKVSYTSFHNVDSKGYLLDRPFVSNQDENFNVFNVDAFLTWDFRLGSRLILGYKNWLGNDEQVMLNSGRNNYVRNLGKTFDLRHGNELTIRFIYFLDYNQLRKKR
ncbi:MAG: carbohydrate binding family 9 domain-containing protein [Sphingobacteriales bacterium]|nr:carbohydrate binding family 9 domain-containing protein [Sphingobacteriales bacterium]